MHKQDGGVEGHALIFPMRTPKMQLADRTLCICSESVESTVFSFSCSVFFILPMILDCKLRTPTHKGLSSQGYGFSSGHVWM